MIVQIIVEAIAAIAIVSACVIVLISISTGGLDDIDTRSPRRRFPK